MNPLVALLALTLQAPPGPPITVGGLVLSAADVSARAEQMTRPGAPTTPEAVADALVAEALFAQEARKTGADATPDGRTALQNARTAALARAYSQREISAKAVPTEDQIKKLFHGTYDTVRLSVVVLATKEEAQAALDRLKKGGEFVLEASRSLHKSAANKGELGPVARIALEERLGDVAFNTAPGSFFGPTALENGFAVGRVNEKVIADEKRIAGERAMLDAIARREIVGFQKRHFLAAARKNRGAKLDQPWLDSLGKRTELSEAELDHAIASVDGKPVPYREIRDEVNAMAAGAFAGHGFGAAIRYQVAENHLDQLLLAAGARDAGLEALPEVKAAVAAAERPVLARLEVVRLLGALPRGTSAEAQRKVYEQRLASLRKAADVRVDMAAVRSAMGRSR